MPENSEFYLVESEALPDIFHKIIQVKSILASGKAKTINEAVHKVGISRSAFYKYKDSVFAFHERSKDKIITLSFTVLDLPGVLSEVMNILARKGADVLTINQNIPINGVANITISFRTGNLKCDIAKLSERLEKTDGVQKIEILASE